MDFYFIRHGETDWNVERRLQGSTDIPLNENGLMQAKQCAKALKNYTYNRLITSPLMRAHQTAQAIADELNLNVEVMDEFTERSFGVAEGLTHEMIQASYPNDEIPGLEPLDEFITRIKIGLDKIIKSTNQTQHRVLIVAHGAVINRFIAHIGKGQHWSAATNVSVTHIQYENEEWRIKDVNNTTYLTNGALFF